MNATKKRAKSTRQLEKKIAEIQKAILLIGQSFISLSDQQNDVLRLMNENGTKKKILPSEKGSGESKPSLVREPSYIA